MMIPVGRLVLLRSVDRADLVSAMSWFLVPGLIGPILGPPIGGLIVTYLDWRWIFYINVPIGVLGIVLTLVVHRKYALDDASAVRSRGVRALRRLRWPACCSASRRRAAASAKPRSRSR